MNNAYLQIVIAGMFWGFGFISSIWVLGAMGPLWQVALRFIIAVFLIDALCRLKLFGLKPVDYRFREFLQFSLPGIFLFALMLFQTWGLKYTTATRSGFITVLYVIFIPLLEKLFHGVRIRRTTMFWIILAMLGTSLICGLINKSGVSADLKSAVNFGDLLTLICAFFASAHVISVNAAVKKIESPLKLHVYQCIWVGGLALITAFCFEGMSWLVTPWSWKVWFGIAELGIGSTAIAFFIQLNAQTKIKPTTLGLLLLLESPWAMFFSFSMGYEVITIMQLLGGVLILVSAAGESLTDVLTKQYLALNRKAGQR